MKSYLLKFENNIQANSNFNFHWQFILINIHCKNIQYQKRYFFSSYGMINSVGGVGMIFLHLSSRNFLGHSDVCVGDGDDGDGPHDFVFPVLHKNEQPSQMHLVPFILN